VPEPGIFEVEVAIGKLRRYTSSGAELIRAGGGYITF
jgi:hypothetical protein